MPRRTNENEAEKKLRRRGGGLQEKTPPQQDPLTTPRETTRSVMSRDRLPMIDSPASKPTDKSSLNAHPNRQRPPQARRRKRAPTAQQPSSNLPDTMTPWGGHSLSESSFTSIPPPPPPPAIPPPTPSSPCSPRLPRQVAGLQSSAPSPPVSAPQERGPRSVRARRRVDPQRRPPRAPRLPPLRPVTNLSFSRSFTFSFFELPLHQSPRCRAERIRDLMVLLRQIQY